MTKRELELRLYWVWTNGHDDDWFVVGSSAASARRFFAEHFDTDEKPKARELATLPGSFQRTTSITFNEPEQFEETGAGWPTDEAIEACGGKFLRADQPRVVELGGETFAEGMLDYKVNAAATAARKRPKPT